APCAEKGIPLGPPLRGGGATLMASGSTGEQWCRSLRPAAGWSAPRPLGLLAPALPGPLHPNQQRPRTFFMLAFRARYRTAEIATSRNGSLRKAVKKNSGE